MTIIINSTPIYWKTFMLKMFVYRRQENAAEHLEGVMIESDGGSAAVRTRSR